jgi:hypothetical protein
MKGDYSMKGSEDDKIDFDTERYETDLGFSKPDSNYIGPQLQKAKNNEKEMDFIDANSGASYIGENTSNHENSGYDDPLYEKQCEANPLEVELGEINPVKMKQSEVDLVKAYFDEKYPDQPNSSIKETTNEPVRHRMSVKQMVLISLPVLAVLIAIVVFYLPGLSFFWSAKEYTFLSDHVLEVYNTNDETYIFNTSGEILHQIKTDGMARFNTNKTAAILTDNNINYYINDKKMITIDASTGNCQISDNGNYLIYTKNIENDNALYFYDVTKEKEELIIQSDHLRYAVPYILDDGKTISYITYQGESPYGNAEAYIMKIGEEPKVVGKNLAVVAMSPKAEYIYYIELPITIGEGSYAFYVRHNGQDTLLMNEYADFRFNRDFTEIMFTDGNSTYLSVKGGEPFQVADGQLLKMITPNRCSETNRMFLGGYIYNIDSYRNKVILLQDNELLLINKRYQPKEISTEYFETMKDFCAISKDGNELIYRTADSRVLRVTNLKGNFTKATILENVDTVITSEDLKKIYYKRKNQLYYMDENYSEKKIKDDVNQVVLNPSGDIAFFTMSGFRGASPLYYSFNGSEAQPVEDCEAVTDLVNWNQGVIIYKEVGGIFSTYYNREGAKFHLLLGGHNVFKNTLFYGW